MLVIGVAVLPKKNTKGLNLQKIFGIISAKRMVCAENPFELLLAMLPYDQEKLWRKNPSKVKKLTEKAKQKLIKKGAQEVVFSTNFMDLLEKKGIYEYSDQKKAAKELFLRYTPECLRQTAGKVGIKLFNSRVCIRDIKMERISEYLINMLCYDVKNLALITQNIQKAKTVCEKFYDETGLLVEVKISETNKFDILVDVDKGCIRFGSDLWVCGADMGYNFLDYNVDQLTVAAASGDVKRLPHGWNFDHKKCVDFIR